MSKVTLEIASREATNRRFLRAFNGEMLGEFISFESPALLFKVLSGKRWEILRLMTGQAPMTIRELARRHHRDVKAVHGDLHALLAAGLITKTELGLIVFPYESLHVDFLLAEAA